MMKIWTTLAQLLSIGLLMAFAGALAAQQAYPNKHIRVIVPYGPGGSPDVVTRLFGQKLTESWGQQVILDNRPGGSTVIGTEALVKSPPDGYTILLAAIGHVTTPLLLSTPYDPIKDFAPVATLTVSQLALVLNPSVPANNLQEFIALAKSKPAQLNYASAGRGGLTHLAAELFNIAAGIKMQHIPYKGPGPAVTDLIGGQVQAFFAGPASFLPHIQAGKLKAIAISGETRSSVLPQVPTFSEAGLQGIDIKFWYGFLAPANTPKEIIDKLSTEIAKILTMPDFKEKLAGQGLEPLVSTPDGFAALLKSETTKWAKVIKTANIKLEN